MQSEVKGAGCSSLVVAFLVRVSARTAQPPRLAMGQNPLRPRSILSPLQQVGMNPLLVCRLCFVIKVAGGLTCGAVCRIGAVAIRESAWFRVYRPHMHGQVVPRAEIYVMSRSSRAPAFQGFAIPIKRVGALLSPRKLNCLGWGNRAVPNQQHFVRVNASSFRRSTGLLCMDLSTT